MKSKKWIFVLCNFLASFFLVACQSGSNGSQSAVEAIKQKGKLVVATSPDYAPSGKADLAVAGISATDERKEVFDFSIPYYENKISFLVRKADVEKYKDLTSLESANIAAQKGTVPESMVKEQLPKAQLTSLTNMGEAVNELQAGKVDAVHMDEPVALSYAAKNAGLAVATVSLKMKDGDANAVALRKNSDDLKEVVDKVIQKLKDEGTYQSYLEKAASLTEVEE
ncbi:TPA: transporter substrate-binding domain-containing protein [Streptococcus pneumoniae]